MQFMKNIAHFIDSYDSAFVVGTIPPKDLLYYNSAATELYGIKDELDLSIFYAIFNNKSYGIQEKIDNGFLDRGYLIVDNVLTLKANGEHLLADVRLGYFDKDKTEVFIEITPKLDNRFEMALMQVNYSTRAEAILNIDEQLSIVHCNASFNEVFGSNKDLRHSYLQNDLVNGFLPEAREKLISDILETLKENKNFSTKIKVFSENGDESWYLFELEKRTLDNSGEDKIMAYMTNIEKQVELEEEVEVVRNFFKAIQNFTDDILYRIDIKTMTLYHLMSPECINDKLNAIGPKVHDYINTLINENIVHPDDHELYRKNAENYLNGNRQECTLRFSISDNNYEWFSIKGYHIYNENGELTEIFGTLINVQEETMFKEEVTTMQKYLKAMQELTEDILYTVDTKTLVLTHNLDTPITKKIGIGKVIHDYRKVFVEEKIIHPDYAEQYLKFLNEWYAGTSEKDECVVRASLINEGEYNWYSIRGKKIYDENGDFVQVIGALVNVDNEKKIQAKANTLNSYFEALQLVSGESFYIIDIKNRILTQKGRVAEELDIHGPVPNFPESVFDMVHKDDLEHFKKYTYDSFEGIPVQFKVRLLTPSREYQWYELNSQIIYDDKGEVSEVIGKMNNIQKQIDLEQKATFDKLTSVLNRETFEDKVIENLEGCNSDKLNALIFIDIDDFKFINDNYGHQFGDFVLQKFTERVCNCIKKTDLIGRVGGDEFVLYLKNIDNRDVALKRANILIDIMKRPISDGKISHLLGLSIGIAVSPTDGLDLKTLYNNGR